MIKATADNPVAVARNYYNSDDADNFYYEVWGGEDIHIGLYRSEDESIAQASMRTVSTMAHQLGLITNESRIADFGAGYGGSARWLARTYGCHVSCVNLSEVQNERNRAMTKAAALDQHIDVHDASFEDAPLGSADYDIVWSQDSFLHAGDRAKVLDEIDRILKPGGALIFTDPMQADDCPDGVLQPVLDRLHLESLGSIAWYRQQASLRGWSEVNVLDMTPQLVAHYTRVRGNLNERRSELSGKISDAYFERMLQGLSHWIDAGSRGYLAWGILHFSK